MDLKCVLLSQERKTMQIISFVVVFRRFEFVRGERQEGNKKRVAKLTHPPTCHPFRDDQSGTFSFPSGLRGLFVLTGNAVVCRMNWFTVLLNLFWWAFGWTKELTFPTFWTQLDRNYEKYPLVYSNVNILYAWRHLMCTQPLRLQVYADMCECVSSALHRWPWTLGIRIKRFICEYNVTTSFGQTVKTLILTCSVRKFTRFPVQSVVQTGAHHENSTAYNY